MWAVLEATGLDNRLSGWLGKWGWPTPSIRNYHLINWIWQNVRIWDCCQEEERWVTAGIAKNCFLEKVAWIDIAGCGGLEGQEEGVAGEREQWVWQPGRKDISPRSAFHVMVQPERETRNWLKNPPWSPLGSMVEETPLYTLLHLCSIFTLCTNYFFF